MRSLTLSRKGMIIGVDYYPLVSSPGIFISTGSADVFDRPFEPTIAQAKKIAIKLIEIIEKAEED